MLGVLEKMNEEADNLQAIVLAPTREIALQAHRTLETLAGNYVRIQLTIGQCLQFFLPLMKLYLQLYIKNKTLFCMFDG